MRRLHKFIIILFLLAFPVLVMAQSTSISLNVTDTAGQAWFGGTWNVQLVNKPGYAQGPWYIAGTSTPVPNQTQNGSLDSSANASFTLTPNASIAPAGSTWNITVCSMATATCYTQQVDAVGSSATIDLTPPPIVVSLANPPPRAAAYADTEVTAASPGSQYFNLTSLHQRLCTASPCSSNWVDIASGSSVLSGSGTTNSITKWTGTYSLGNADATDNGTTFTINDLLSAANANFTNATITNLTSTNSTITNLTVTNVNGAAPGTLTNATLTGDGTVVASPLGSGCSSTTNFNCALALVPVLPDYVLAGPIGAAGSNVAFKTSLKCTSVSTNATCSLTGLTVGEAILIVSGTQSYWTGGTSDTLGTTFTDYGGGRYDAPGVWHHDCGG